MEKNETYSIPKEQIEVAITRFENGDYVGAIAIAGVAEATLGRVLAAQGVDTALDTAKKIFEALTASSFGERAAPGRFEKVIAHNQSFPSEREAADTILRAIENLFRLTNDETVPMRTFREGRAA